MWQFIRSRIRDNSDPHAEDYDYLECTLINENDDITLHKLSIKNQTNKKLQFTVQSTKNCISKIIKHIETKLRELSLTPVVITRLYNTINFEVLISQEAFTYKSILEILDDILPSFKEVIKYLPKFVTLDHTVFQNTFALQQRAATAGFTKKAENTMWPMVFASARKSELALREAFNFPAPFYPSSIAPTTNDTDEGMEGEAADNENDLNMQRALLATFLGVNSLSLRTNVSPPPSSNQAAATSLLASASPAISLYPAIRVLPSNYPAVSPLRFTIALRPDAVARDLETIHPESTEHLEDDDELPDVRVALAQQDESRDDYTRNYEEDEYEEDEHEEDEEQYEDENHNDQLAPPNATSHELASSQYNEEENLAFFTLIYELRSLLHEHVRLNNIFPSSSGGYTLSPELFEVLVRAKTSEPEEKYGIASLCFDLMVTLNVLTYGSYSNNKYLEKTKISGYGLRNIVALLWHCILAADHSNPKRFCVGITKKDAIEALIHGIANGARGNNRNSNDNEADDLNDDDLLVCDTGKYNSLISSMLGILPQVELNYNYLDLLQHTLKEELYKMLMAYNLATALRIVNAWTKPQSNAAEQSSIPAEYAAFVTQARNNYKTMRASFIKQNFDYDPDTKRRVEEDLDKTETTMQSEGMSMIDAVSLSSAGLLEYYNVFRQGQSTENDLEDAIDIEMGFGLPAAAASSARSRKRYRPGED